MPVLKEQWLGSGSKLTLTEFVKEQAVKTVREMIQVAKSSNDPLEATRILFDAITSSVNLYAGNDVTSLDSVETFLNAASHDEISSVMGEFVRQMIQTGLYQTVSEKTLFRKFIEKVKALARKNADVFAPAKEGRYGKLIQERLNGIEELLAYASTKTGAKASRIKAEGPAVSKLQEDQLLRDVHLGATAPQYDFKTLVEQTEVIQLQAQDLRWFDWGRYSQRQQQEMQLGGLLVPSRCTVTWRPLPSCCTWANGCTSARTPPWAWAAIG